MMLTIHQLNEKFPTGRRDAVKCWQRLLSRWRHEGKLLLRRDWRFVEQPEPGYPANERLYDCDRVCLLLYRYSEHPFASTVLLAHAGEIMSAVRRLAATAPTDTLAPPLK